MLGGPAYWRSLHPAWTIRLPIALALVGPGVCGCAGVRTPTPSAHQALFIPAAPRAGERFYVTVFAAQSVPNLVRYSHSWATVIQVASRQEGQEILVEHHTISWMPHTRVIHPLTPYIEEPLNLGLYETVNLVLANGTQMIYQWGPYECTPQYYERFVARKRFLDSGRIGYQCLDGLGEAGLQGNGCNCIHALMGVFPEVPPEWSVSTEFGEPASRRIVEQLSEQGALVHPEQTHGWLNAMLCLDRYPILHRDANGP
jgi:hypothetical protein